MAGDFADLNRKLAEVAKGIESPQVVRAAGLAAKKAATEVAKDVSGGDQRLSGWGRRGIKLGVGFDEAPGQVTLNLRPGGVWVVMEQGRRGGKVVRPRKRRGARALSTPYGPRASITLGATRGKRAVARSQDDARREAVRAARSETTTILRKAFR